MTWAELGRGVPLQPFILLLWLGGGSNAPAMIGDAGNDGGGDDNDTVTMLTVVVAVVVVVMAFEGEDSLQCW